MCGISGFCNSSAEYTKDDKWNQILINMQQALRHRGPDDKGSFLTKCAGLSHTRLSIIDLKYGHQPMIKRQFGNTYAIVYNGELYNMHELRHNLEKEGSQFETVSDTEVILNGYISHGPDFVKKLNGIFAFAVWDEIKETLTLFRDRLGVKPLFYTFTQKTLVFGSELKALFEYPCVKPQIDQKGLCEIFALGPAKTYGNGVFKGINEVLPGCYCTYNKNQFKNIIYWSLKGKEHTDSYESTVSKVSDLVYDSIHRQMLSDIPICTFLSGGLDSSLVTAVCAKELEKKGKTLNTFSFDFVDNAKHFASNSFQPSIDQPYAKIMANHVHSNHTNLECDITELADYLYKAVDARDLPCMADVESSLLYFCSIVARHNQVTLTGECADEIFGGYPWFHSKEAFHTNNFPWSKNMATRTCLLSDDLIACVDFKGYAQNAYEQTIKETPTYNLDNPEEARRREISFLNIKWFMATLLDRMDRTSMYSGLEARVPLADHRILEYVFNIPWHMKCKNGVEKSLLREASKNLLPNEILHRKKSPYPKTYNPAYEKLLGNRLLEVLSNPNSPILPLIDKNKIHAFLNSPSDYGKPWYGQLMAGPQLLAYLLQINYWLKKYHVEILSN
jgi:asparagine synthase (glutamine-hydrolysing)